MSNTVYMNFIIFVCDYQNKLLADFLLMHSTHSLIADNFRDYTFTRKIVCDVKMFKNNLQENYND
jgi:hypothetical protein